MTTQCVSAVVLVLLALSPLPAAPATAPAREAPKVDSWDVSRLGRSSLGDVWSGPDVKRADLRGKVVLLEFWGYRCAPCIRSMPHLVSLHNRHAGEGLVVIGAHVGASAKAEAMAVVRRIKVPYTILSGAFVPDAGLTRIPVAMVFDGDGRMVYQGMPDGGMDRAIKRALTARPHPVLGGKKYPTMALAVTKIVAGRVGEAWGDCKAKAKVKGRTGREAGELMAAIDRYGKGLLADARRARKSDRAAGDRMLRKIAAEFRGCPHATEAEKLLRVPAPNPSSPPRP